MNNEQNKPAELTEKELAGIAGGATATEVKIVEAKKGKLVLTAAIKTNLLRSFPAELSTGEMPN